MHDYSVALNIDPYDFAVNERRGLKKYHSCFSNCGLAVISEIDFNDRSFNVVREIQRLEFVFATNESWYVSTNIYLLKTDS